MAGTPGRDTESNSETTRKDTESNTNPNSNPPVVSATLGIGGMVGIVSAVIVVIILVFGFFLLYRKFVQLDNRIAGLSYEEVREFKEGKAGGMGNEAEDLEYLIDSLPYNNKYELSRKKIFIGKLFKKPK